MGDFLGTILFSLIMGLSIFISLPIVMHKKTSERATRLFNSIAIGILVFLIADIFSNVASAIYNGSLAGFGDTPSLSIVFAVALAVGFFMLYIFENRSKTGLTPAKMSFMIASGMGLQNLTEGLVFGATAHTLGLFSGVSLVILIGFILQDITEGFPIASPFLNSSDKKLGIMIMLFAVGGIPTVLGGAIGYYYSSSAFNIFFDGLAIGAILYVIIPMIRHQVKDIDNLKQKLVYIGIFVGFLLGFLVNLI